MLSKMIMLVAFLSTACVDFVEDPDLYEPAGEVVYDDGGPDAGEHEQEPVNLYGCNVSTGSPDSDVGLGLGLIGLGIAIMRRKSFTSGKN